MVKAMCSASRVNGKLSISYWIQFCQLCFVCLQSNLSWNLTVCSIVCLGHLMHQANKANSHPIQLVLNSLVQLNYLFLFCHGSTARCVRIVSWLQQSFLRYTPNCLPNGSAADPIDICRNDAELVKANICVKGNRLIGSTEHRTGSLGRAMLSADTGLCHHPWRQCAPAWCLTGTGPLLSPGRASANRSPTPLWIDLQHNNNRNDNNNDDDRRISCSYFILITTITKTMTIMKIDNDVTSIAMI